MIVSVDVDRLAALAFAEAERHPAGSRERRAASHLYFSLTVPAARSLAAAHRAVESYGTPITQAAALALLDKITRQETAP